MRFSPSRPSLAIRPAGREQQVLVPVPLTWPIRPPQPAPSPAPRPPSSTATVSFRMTTFLPVIPRRSSSSSRERPTSCPSQPVITTSLSILKTRPSRSGVISAW